MSHEAVEAVTEYANECMGLATDESEWKEIDRDEEKGPHGEEYDHITFQHTSGVELHAITHVDDGEEWQVSEGGTLLYDLGEDENMKAYGGGLYINFCPKSFWERNGYIPSDRWHEHEGAVLMIVFDLPAAVAENELMEGNFGPPGHITDMASAHSYLQKQGFEYRDMTAARATAAATAAASVKRPTDKATVVDVLLPIIKEFETGGEFDRPGDFFIGQKLVEQFEQYDWPEELETLTLEILTKNGIPDAINNVFADADKDEFIERLKRAARGGVSNMPLHKAVSAVAASEAAAKVPPVDLTGKPMDEIYRLAIRGKIPQIAAVAFCFDDDRKGGATEDEIGWYCGYLGHDGKLIRDLCIPDHVFEGWFPEYKKITWNDYEPKDISNYHTMPSPAEQHVEGFRAILNSRYIDRGAIRVDDMLDAPKVPLAPTGTSAVARTVAPPPTYGGSSASHIVTLKAFPPGHTGKAPPVVATPAPVEAPTSVNTASDPEKLWREYQLDITALAAHGIQRAGYQIVDTTPHIVFAVGFLDEAGGIVETVPQSEVIKLFSEYKINCLDDGITYRIIKLFGQQLSDLEKVVRERLKDVKIFDVAN